MSGLFVQFYGERIYPRVYPGGAKEARAPRGSKAKTVKSACSWLIFT